MPLLLDYLIRQFPLAKRQNLKRMVEEGRITINGQPARRLKQVIQEGDLVQIGQRTQRPGASIEPLRIIHEDTDVLVVDKPPGLLTSTNEKERRATAIALVRAYLADREPRARAGIIHRLDRDASGLLVFSKNNQAFEDLKRQFFEHSVDRIYTAVVQGTPSPASGRIESRLMELPDGRVVQVRDVARGQAATTDYLVLRSEGGLSLLQITLQTGRKHQIRTHLASRGHPIVGDSVYGQAGPGQRLMLAATTLAFTHPRSQQRHTFEIAPPPPLLEAFEQRS